MIAKILDCTSSPYTCLRPVGIESVRFQPGFWADWQEVIHHITIPTQYALLENTGRLDNFRRSIVSRGKTFQGYFFNDSDVYKWLEAASWSLVANQDREIRQYIDEIVGLISAAQEENGYLNTYFSEEKKSERWTNLRDMHELYCAGHLIQAAIAHYRVTGEDDLLIPAVNLANHICDRFLKTGKPGTPGHPEIEMALVELYRATGDTKYLEMSRSFLDQRGHGLIGGRTYHLDRVPLRGLERLEGHAVRALYLACGAADIYLETGDIYLWETLERLWERMVLSQLYVTGGVGSRHKGESFGDEYELPNARAYAETCAAIASVMWNWRMLHCTADAKYADLIEWTLYNAVLPGISLSGEKYFYVNPLEVNYPLERQPWFDCACCPTNIVRLLACIGGYFYSQFNDEIWIHQYTSNIADIQLPDGLVIRLSVKTEYPWDGHVEINFLASGNRPEVNTQKIKTDQRSYSLNLRIPSWLSEKIPIYINDDLWQEYGNPGTYLNIRRGWRVGDKITFNFPMPVRLIEGHPFIKENINHIAISKGPLLYCIEAEDNPNQNPREIILLAYNEYETQPIPDLPMKVVGIPLEVENYIVADRWSDRLYKESIPEPSYVYKNVGKVLALPYFAWGNRHADWMHVWLKRGLGS